MLDLKMARDRGAGEDDGVGEREDKGEEKAAR